MLHFLVMSRTMYTVCKNDHHLLLIVAIETLHVQTIITQPQRVTGRNLKTLIFD